MYNDTRTFNSDNIKSIIYFYKISLLYAPYNNYNKGPYNGRRYQY